MVAPDLCCWVVELIQLAAMLEGNLLPYLTGERVLNRVAALRQLNALCLVSLHRRPNGPGFESAAITQDRPITTHMHVCVGREEQRVGRLHTQTQTHCVFGAKCGSREKLTSRFKWRESTPMPRWGSKSMLSSLPFCRLSVR